MHAPVVRLLAAAVIAISAHAAPSVSTSGSLRVLEDSNLYLQNPSQLAAGQKAPAAAWNQWATAVDASASIAVRWRDPDRRSFEVAYAPEVFRYLDHASENHTDHLVTVIAGGKSAGWAYAENTRYLYTDGSNEGPTYNGLGGTPAIGGEPVRARRTQAILRSSGKATLVSGPRFVRAVYSVFDQQFHTVERNVTGYCNYADRDESCVGADAGYRVGAGVAAVAGGRAGFQQQANLLGVPQNYSNTFTRWLMGLEKAAGSTLQFAVFAGPELHHYGSSVRPGFVRDQQSTYVEGSLTWTPSSANSLAVTCRRYLWLSSGGRGLYVDSVVDIAWKRKLSPEWSSSVAANLHDGDTSHFNRPAPRHDQIYTETATLTRTLSPHARAELAVLHDRGASFVPATPSRAYTRWITSAAVIGTW